MELIFADPYYDSEEEESGRFIAELKEALVEFDQNVEVIESDIGRGADWPVALVELFQSIDWPTVASTVGPISLYFLGERIKKNGEAWLEMARGLKRLLSKHRPSRICRVSDDYISPRSYPLWLAREVLSTLSEEFRG